MPAHAAVIAWSDRYVDTDTINNGNTITGSDDNIMTIGTSVVNPGGLIGLPNHGSSPYFQYRDNQFGGYSDGHARLGLEIEDTGVNNNTYLQFTMTFQTALTRLEFSLLDVDDSANTLDAVEIYYNGANNLADNAGYYTLHPSVARRDNAYINGFAGTAAAEASSDAANIDISIDDGTLIESVTIRYFVGNDHGVTANWSQYIGITDLDYQSQAPEPASIALLTVASAILFAIRRRNLLAFSSHGTTSLSR